MRPTNPKDGLGQLDREWVDRVTAILTNGATLAEQMIGEMLSFRWNSATPPPPIALRTLTKRPSGLLVLSATPTADTSSTSSCVAVVWKWSTSRTAGSVTIVDMALAASTDFDVVAWAIGG